MPFSLQFRLTNLPPNLPARLDPLEALERIASIGGGDIAFLHSGGSNGFSVLAFDPLAAITVNASGDATWKLPPALATPPAANAWPLQLLEQFARLFAFDSPHPLLGHLGFLSYDLAHTLENIPRHASEELHWPLLSFTLYHHYLIFDPDQNISCYALGSPELGAAPAFDFPAVSPPTPKPSGGAQLITHLRREDYLQKIERVRNYIAAGDIYQANLAQRWIARTQESPIAIFRRLAGISPAPYSAFLRHTDAAGTTRHILSASPELFLTVDSARHTLTRPIKGTRPRDLVNDRQDAALREELLESEKDRAELAMIVDLLRNDLGRVSRFGSVRVTEPRTIEKHPTVWHTVATIESDLRPNVGLAELLAALCPGGSITGAPKIRATQIIEELEGFRRALYCGNIGVLGNGSSGTGTVALNIAIRTILMLEGHAHIFAGGGIVADSDPNLEYEETLHKAAALFRALNLPLKKS